jgi:hypothetical protein
MEKIVCYRLINGYEIIGKCDPDADINSKDDIHLKNALTHVISQEEENGKVKMRQSFVPVSFLTAADAGDLPKGCDIVLKKTSIAFEYQLAPQFLESYTQQTTPIIMSIPNSGFMKLS